MRKCLSAFTLVELMVIVVIAAVLSLLLLPALTQAQEESGRKACASNLSQIAKACITYQEPNGDFYPANAQYQPKGAVLESITRGGEVLPSYSPMTSLAILYPAFIDEAKVFGCPLTLDRPVITFAYNGGSRWTTFGKPPAGVTPNAYAGQEVATDQKCSYFYDEHSYFRELGPGQAMAADADGQTWKTPEGLTPPYPAGWTRAPRQPNHPDGPNVMYFDGHVKYCFTAYASSDPKDNIFCPNGAVGPNAYWDPRDRKLVPGQWDPDTDAFLWDGSTTSRLVVPVE